MAKMWTFLILSVGLTILLKMAGIPIGSDWLLTFVGLDNNVSSVSNSLFYAALTTILLTSTGAAIVVGIFGRTAPEYAILAPFAFANLLLFLATFAAVINYMSSFDTWLYFPVLLIFGVLSIGYIWTTIEWVFGRDS